MKSAKRVVKISLSQHRASQTNFKFVHSFFLFYLCVLRKNLISNRGRFGHPSIMSCETQEPTETVMANNLLNIEDTQRWKKKQKIFNPNHTMQEEADLPPGPPSATFTGFRTSPGFVLNLTFGKSGQCELDESNPGLQPLGARGTQLTDSGNTTRSDSIVPNTVSHMDPFILQFKAREHKVEEFTQQIAVLARSPVAPAERNPPLTQTDLSGNVVQSPPDLETRTSLQPAHWQVTT